MSVVTNVIVTTAPFDLGEADTDDHIPAHLAALGLRRVDQHAGGTKAME